MPYKNPDALVSTAWLSDHLDDQNIKILDASYFVPGGVTPAKEQYDEGHIPGALFFDINDVADQSKSKEHAFPDAQTFAEKVGALGINNEDHIVAYDHLGGACAAARVWFMFRAFGHDKVAVLDGGRTKWSAEGRALSTDAPNPEKRKFATQAIGGLLRQKSGILENIEAKTFQLLDARSKGRFEGTEPEPREGLRSGHIPASLNLPFSALFDAETKTWRDEPQIIQVFAAAGVDFDKPLTTTCGSGVTACTLALGAYLIGSPDTAIYDGSWVEWGAESELPIETGPAKAR